MDRQARSPAKGDLPVDFQQPRKTLCGSVMDRCVTFCAAAEPAALLLQSQGTKVDILAVSAFLRD